MDATWFVAAVLVGGVGWNMIPGRPWMSVVTVVLLYSSLVAHEFAHIFVGRKMGLEIKEIILSILGATAYFEGGEGTGGAVLAAAGPAFSLVLAALLAGTTAVTMEFARTTDLLQDLLGSIFALGTVMNVMIAAFNLLPVYPLDGGRILHAGLLRMTGSHLKAITISAGLTVTAALAIIGWSEWNLIVKHEGGGLLRILAAVVLGGQALGAYRTELKRSKKGAEKAA